MMCGCRTSVQARNFYGHSAGATSLGLHSRGSTGRKYSRTVLWIERTRPSRIMGRNSHSDSSSDWHGEKTSRLCAIVQKNKNIVTGTFSGGSSKPSKYRPRARADSDASSISKPCFRRIASSACVETTHTGLPVLEGDMAVLIGCRRRARMPQLHLHQPQVARPLEQVGRERVSGAVDAEFLR